jgi:hypothetical protein
VHHANHSAEHYYAVRDLKPEDDFDRAARTLYLNRTCWNGLYRVCGCARLSPASSALGTFWSREGARPHDGSSLSVVLAGFQASQELSERPPSAATRRTQGHHRCRF